MRNYPAPRFWWRLRCTQVFWKGLLSRGGWIREWLVMVHRGRQAMHVNNIASLEQHPAQWVRFREVTDGKNKKEENGRQT